MTAHCKWEPVSIDRTPLPYWNNRGTDMNTAALRMVIDLDNMALHVRFKGGEAKLVDLLTRAARMIEKLNRENGDKPGSSDDEGTPA